MPGIAPPVASPSIPLANFFGLKARSHTAQGFSPVKTDLIRERPEGSRAIPDLACSRATFQAAVVSWCSQHRAEALCSARAVLQAAEGSRIHHALRVWFERSHRDWPPIPLA
jgi:hypothetical protein